MMLGLAGPLALANLLQMLTYAIDVMFIAHLGPAELAASALIISIFAFFLWALQSLIGAVAPIMAAELGARSPALRPIRRSMRMALWLCVAFGAITMGLLTFSKEFMTLTGQEPHITLLADSYIAILLFSTIPMMISSLLRNFVATLGRPMLATIITAISIGINAFANWVFIFGELGMPALGLPGAGLATCITAFAMVAMYFIAIRMDPHLARYHILGFFWRPDWLRMREIVRIGTPIALTVMAEAGVFGAAAFLMGRIGALELAAHAIALQIAALAFQIPYGVGQAATIRVGYFYGAGDKQGISQSGNVAIIMGTGFMVLTAAIMVIAPKALLAIYIDVSAPENIGLIAHATSFLLIGAAFQLFDGMQAVTAGALRGLQDTKAPMWIALFSYWVPGFGLAAGLGLATSLAGVGVWLGLAAGLTFAALLLLWRWWRRESLGLNPIPRSQS